MNRYLDDSHRRIRDTVREFARTEVAAVAAEFDRTAEFPWENVKRMAELGLLGIPWEKDLGGLGLDMISFVLTIHELAKVDASHAITISAHTSLATASLVRFGSTAQKEKFVPLLASGAVLGGFGLTEPSAGSDAAASQTTAQRVGGGWILNGRKIFITHGGVGEVFVITAVTEPSKGAEGLTAFIVTKPSAEIERAKAVGVGHSDELTFTEGFASGTKHDKMGWRASDTRELILENAFVADENVLGEPGQGFSNFLQALDGGRIGLAALALGIAEGAYELALTYARERRQFGRPIAEFQAVQFMLADMATEIEAATHLVYNAAALMQAGQPFSREASMAKLFASELAMRTTTKAVQIHGGYGYMKDYSVERMMRDAKICEIGEGTSEIQRMVIARSLLRQGQGVAE